MLDHNSASRKPDILIIDDDASLRLLMKEILTTDAYTINEASNGIDALDLIKKQQPDLVLLDVKMPAMSGFEVCAEIRRLYGDTNISIVMVTGLNDAASIEKAYEFGATDFISKPINWDTFPYRIQYLIKARDAIIESKRNELHLGYIEHVSSILTQNKNKEILMQETITCILNIFSADRAIIIKPDDVVDNSFSIDCEVASDHIENINNLADPVIDILENNIFYLAGHSEYPLVSHYNASNPAPKYNPDLKQQMIKALALHDNKNWYLVIQKWTDQPVWTILDEETFNRICLRLADVLSRSLLTEKLHYNEQLAQELGHLGNWNWNVISNHLTWSNEIYRIYGYQSDSYKPELDKFYEIVFEEDSSRINQFNNIRQNINDSYKIEHRIRIPDGSIRWLVEQCVGSYDEAGKLLEVNGIVQDITEAHIRKEQEVHNNKMDAIGQLTSGIAHDFGNLMTVANGNLELLEESISKQGDIDDDSLEILKDARSAVQDSVELTKQLLAFSRKKSIAPVYVNIEKTINKFKKLFQNTLGDSIKMSVNIQQVLPDILVDPAQFESALLNIIINARNAMPDGGSLVIDADIMSTEKTHGIIRYTNNDFGDECTCIYITDSGTGMSKDVLAHAIEPFYTTCVNQGTGLGLSMVYSFIKQSGGELLIRSQPEQGTTVYMQFPICEDKVIESQKTATVSSLSDTQATILVVEDRYTVRQFAARCLNKPGIKILQAMDAAEARELLKSNNIDLLFTDILMPGDMNGFELADWASKEYPDLKILLTTAMENEPYKKYPRSNYNFKLLPKPYSKSELTEIVTELLKNNTI